VEASNTPHDTPPYSLMPSPTFAHSSSRYDAQDVQEFFNNGAFGTGNRMQKDIQTVTSSLVWRFTSGTERCLFHEAS
jgi:hypothetical protein